MHITEMDGDMRSASEEIAIELMVPKLREAGIDLSDIDAVRRALVEARFGRALIANCAERAAARAREIQQA